MIAAFIFLKHSKTNKQKYPKEKWLQDFPILFSHEIYSWNDSPSEWIFPDVLSASFSFQYPPS